MDLINNIDIDLDNLQNREILQDEKEVSELLMDKDSMYVFHMNIRSLSNIDQFIIYGGDFINELQIIIFTETWGNDKKVTQSLPNFSGYFSQRFINQNSGVAAYVRKDINIIEIKEIKFSHANCLQLEILYKQKKIILIAIYRSPERNREHIFISELNDYLQLLGDKIKHVVLMGEIPKG
uniref:Uncharacterized protein n=1 Tax=Cacopsylla melanoneura TaxID=428564 RepID=A0A8D9EI29_9HEMI